MRPQLLACFLLLAFFVFTQNVLPIGAWRADPPKRVGLSVTQSDNQIFYTTRAALMILDKDEIAPSFKTTVDGLSGVDFRMIRFHEPSGKLVIVYEDGIIDLFDDGDIVTVRAIKNFTNITGEKKINDIFEYDANTLFLAGSYGVSAFRIDNGSFPFSTFMGEAKKNNLD